jgi:Trk K+ transport system NAD-binding subunit
MPMANADANPPCGHVIVCGLGHVGFRIACLLARLGMRGTVVAREASDDRRAAVAPHFSVILGDAREDRLLIEAGIQRATAILAVTNDDLANVSMALDARRLNPNITIVARVFDQKLAMHLEESVEIDRVLSASALAAPAFVAAALGATVRGAFAIDETTCLIEESTIDAAAASAGRTVDQWTAQTGRAVLAIHRGDETLPHPRGATVLAAGDRLVGLGFRQGNDECVAGLRQSPRRVSALRAFAAGLREWWRDAPRALRAALLALTAVVALSVVVFRFALDMKPVDAFYFVITTVTTTGYGDYNLLEAPPWLKLYGSFVMLCGAAIIALLFSIVTDLVLRTRFRDVIARGCARYEGHIIVAGLGNIGFRLVRELAHSGETVVAIECREDAEYLQAARELGPVVLGNAKMEETLRRAGAAGAKAIVAATDDDLANLSIALATQHACGGCHVVLRLFDAQLAEKMQRSLGVGAVLSVSAAAAPTFVGAALCPDTLQGVLLPDHLVLIFSRTFRPGVGRSECRGPQAGEAESVLFVRRAGATRYEAAAADCALGEGDTVLGARWHPFQDGQGQP